MNWKKEDKRIARVAVSMLSVHYILAIIAIIVIFTMTGCASFRDMPDEKKVLLSYDIMGETLVNAKPALMRLCADGSVSPEDCARAKTAYNEAVDIYKVLGDIGETAIDTGDDSKYNTLSIQLMDLLIIISKYTGG